MKKMLIVGALLMIALVDVSAQCKLPFPNKKWGKGFTQQKPNTEFVSVFFGTNNQGESMGLITVIDNQSNTKSTGSHFMKFTGATERLNNTKIKLINFDWDTVNRQFNYIISEFVDTASNSMFAIEYGNKVLANPVDSVKMISYLLPVERIDLFAPLHKAFDLVEKEVYSSPNGSYLYEIFDKQQLCGIRYYSLANSREYLMFFR